MTLLSFRSVFAALEDHIFNSELTKKNCPFKNNSIFVSWIKQGCYRWRKIDHLKHKLLFPTVINESLAQDLLDDEEEVQG